MTHPWFPVSPCGDACRTGTEPTVGALRRAGRVAAAVAVLLAAVAAAPLLPVAGRNGRNRLVRTVLRGLLRAFGVRLVVRGSLAGTPGRGALVAHNHVSWLDTVAVNAVRPMRALAKKDIAGWPVLGRLVTAAGSVYVDRDRLRTLPATVAELADVMRAGALADVCAEGTTWCGEGPGRFVAAPFQAAVDAGVPVVPVAVRYRTADGRDATAPAFIGSDTILDSVRRVAALRGLVVEVLVLPEIAPGTAPGRRELAALAEASVRSALGRSRLAARTPVTRPGEVRRSAGRA